MFAKGPMPGYSPKAEVLAHFPDAKCSRFHASGITGYVVKLPNGKQIGTGGSSAQAWKNVRVPDGVETVYFRRVGSLSEDSITVPAGTATKHVDEKLITRIVPVPHGVAVVHGKTTK
jgi:hypothetical protein